MEKTVSKFCVCWNKDNAQQDLKAWPEGEKINRSKFAREHKINAKNGGEVVKGLDGQAQ